MPGVVPEEIRITADGLEELIYNSLFEFFEEAGHDISTPEGRKKVSHNELTLALKYIYNNIFKAQNTLCNNQHSRFNYNDLEILTIIANCFIEICLKFNKSLGLLQFSLMCGIAPNTLNEWLSDTLNPQRMLILKNIQQYHKMEQINLLNESPVGALAVANNDNETGLNWNRQQAQLQQNSTVYILPSERLDKLRIEQQDKNN